MGQQYSDMTTYEQYVSNNSGQRVYPVTKITIHHMAGNLSVQTCANVLQNNGVSANYGVNGTEVGLYCAENIRTWCSCDWDNDQRAVTIEVANDEYGGNWHVSDTTLNTLIKLVADICKRQGIPQLNYTGNAAGNLTRHDYFAATCCPGPYLGSKFPYIASEVNRILNGGSPEPQPEPQPTPAGKITVDGWWGQQTTLKAQQVLKSEFVDGIVSGQYAPYHDMYLPNADVSSWEFGSVATGSNIICHVQGMCCDAGFVTDIDGIMGPDSVMKLQQFLNSKGNSLWVDGIMGEGTVRAFQTYLNTL